jgi:hypothetical protein
LVLLLRRRLRLFSIPAGCVFTLLLPLLVPLLLLLLLVVLAVIVVVATAAGGRRGGRRRVERARVVDGRRARQPRRELVAVDGRLSCCRVNVVWISATPMCLSRGGERGESKRREEGAMLGVFNAARARALRTVAADSPKGTNGRSTLTRCSFSNSANDASIQPDHAESIMGGGGLVKFFWGDLFSTHSIYT